MKLVRLKKLPRFTYTSPLGTLNENQAVIWAEGRGADVLYEFKGQWIIRMDDGKPA